MKIQINFKKPGFWKEKSVEDMVTLECLPFNSSRRNCDVPFGVVGKIWQNNRAVTQNPSAPIMNELWQDAFYLAATNKVFNT